MFAGVIFIGHRVDWFDLHNEIYVHDIEIFIDCYARLMADWLFLSVCLPVRPSVCPSLSLPVYVTGLTGLLLISC